MEVKIMTKRSEADKRKDALYCFRWNWTFPELLLV